MGVCRMLPHGAYALVCAVLSTLAWLASLIQDTCDFAQLTGDLVELLTQNPEIPYVDVGFAQFRAPTPTGSGGFTMDSSSSCSNYPSSLVSIDGHWKAAKGFDFMALVLGGGGTLFLWFSTCFVFSKGTWRWAGYEVLLASIFQAFSFLWFGTGICATNTCRLSWGSKADIVACIFWFITAVMIFGRYPSPKDDDGVERGDEMQHHFESNGGGGAPTLDENGNVITPSDGPMDGDGLHLTDVPLEGDASATLPGQYVGGPTKSMTDAEVV